MSARPSPASGPTADPYWVAADQEAAAIATALDDPAFWALVVPAAPRTGRFASLEARLEGWWRWPRIRGTLLAYHDAWCDLRVELAPLRRSLGRLARLLVRAPGRLLGALLWLPFTILSRLAAFLVLWLDGA